MSHRLLRLALPALGLLAAHGTLSASAQALPALHAEGRHILDASGNPVILRAVNIGGWLVTEGWMCGQTDQNDRRALERLEERFGVETAARLMNLWYDNWFNEADLDLIESWGFNAIRVPFGWRNLQNADGEWHRTADGSIDFSRMDWVVQEAGKRGMYVIFDLHRWPGEYGEISRHTAQGEKVRRQMADLWGEIARHFKGNTTIAGFDVINEPEGSPGDLPHRAFYDAVRKEDPHRLMFMVWSAVRDWEKYGWTNVVVSDHYPEAEVSEIPPEDLEKRLDAFEEKFRAISPQHFDYPQFVGEAKAPLDTMESAQDMVAAFEKRGWSWAIWTYKGINVGGWAAFNYYGSLEYDMSTVTEDDLDWLWGEELTRWQDPTADRNYYFTQWWIDGFAPALQ